MSDEDAYPKNRWGREEDAKPVDSPHGTTMPRHIAAVLDNTLSMVVSVLVAKQLPESWFIVQVGCLAVSYLAYFFVFECLFSTSPGKWMNGLVVRNSGGGRCSLKQAFIRTLFRLLDVNPILLGALPDAARILGSRDKQRFGDKIAATVVVFR